MTHAVISATEVIGPLPPLPKHGLAEGGRVVQPYMSATTTTSRIPVTDTNPPASPKHTPPSTPSLAAAAATTATIASVPTLPSLTPAPPSRPPSHVTATPPTSAPAPQRRPPRRPRHTRAMSSVGVGTVGLYAALATPVATHENGSQPSHAYYLPAFYRTPRYAVTEQWGRREADFVRWRSSHLSRSLYHTFAAHAASDDPARVERGRLRCLARMRAAAAAARDADANALAQNLLERYRRARAGVGVDLPPAYYAVVDADPTTTVTLAPALVTSVEHHRACVAARARARAARDALIDHRHTGRVAYRDRLRRELAASRAEEDAFATAWVRDRRHGSRRAAAARHAARTAAVQAESHAVHTLYAHARATAAAIRAQEADERAAHQRWLRHTVCPRTPSHDVAGRGVSHETTTMAPPCKPTTMPALVYAPTSTSFLAEVRLWEASFESPNVIPPCGSDPDFRKEWWRTLSRERQRVNADAVTQSRARYPAVMLHARETTAKEKARMAEEARVSSSRALQRLHTWQSDMRDHVDALHELHVGQLARLRELRAAQTESRHRAAAEQRTARAQEWRATATTPRAGSARATHDVPAAV